MCSHVSLEADVHCKHIACLSCMAQLAAGRALSVHNWAAGPRRVRETVARLIGEASPARVLKEV